MPIESTYLIGLPVPRETTVQIQKSLMVDRDQFHVERAYVASKAFQIVVFLQIYWSDIQRGWARCFP